MLKIVENVERIFDRLVMVILCYICNIILTRRIRGAQMWNRFFLFFFHSESKENRRRRTNNKLKNYNYNQRRSSVFLFFFSSPLVITTSPTSMCIYIVVMQYNVFFTRKLQTKLYKTCPRAYGCALANNETAMPNGNGTKRF